MFHYFLVLSVLSFLNNINAMLRESSFPYISGDSFRAIANHIYEPGTTLNPYNIQNKDIIFIKADKLQQFFNEIHPYIQVKYIIISHNADEAAPGQFINYLADEKILFWFGHNPSIINHPKFIPIPLGIANRYWEHGNIETFTRIIKGLRFENEKKYLLGINFRIGTNPSARKSVAELFINKPYCAFLYSNNHEIYLRNMAYAKFVISPEGNALDCHRIWEALLMGCIPIVISSPMDTILKDLPVFIINDWHEITEEVLIKKYEEINKNFFSYNFAKLYFFYWFKLIEFYKNNLN